MPRKKKPIVEIVPTSEMALVPKAPTANFQAVLDRMVRDRVDEILTERGAALLEPDFHTREIAIEIQQHQTVFDRRKWGLYFEKWGCRMCGKKQVSHGTKGYCDACHHLIYDRLAHRRHFDV